jgi:uncharacterized protein (AIM24 family)
VDKDCVLCFESSVQVDVKTVNGFLTCCCSGEGLFHTTFTGSLSFYPFAIRVDMEQKMTHTTQPSIFWSYIGPGEIWIQSMSIDKMRRLFPPKVQQSGGGDTSGGSSD